MRHRVGVNYGLPVVEGLGFAALGLLGAEAFFAPGAEGVGVAATLVPALALGIAVTGYRLLQMAEERAGQDESMLEPAEEQHSPDQPASDPDTDEMASTPDEGNRRPNVPPGGGLRPSTPG